MPEETQTTPTAPTSTVAQRDAGTLRLALFVGGLVVALIAGFGIGRLDKAPGASVRAGAAFLDAGAGHTHPPGTAPHDHSAGGTAQAPVDGLSISAAGYTLVPETTTVRAGTRRDFRFHIQGPDRRPVTAFAVVHDKPMHLVVARRDLTGYQHLHPTIAPDGTWNVPLALPTPGIWRAYADFTAVTAAGRQTALTLGVDLVAAGTYTPRPLPPPAREAAVDGFTVTYEGTPQVGVTQPLLFRVWREGRPVGDLQPYLGAYGHLVALREGDLGYVHVHPETQPADGAVKFWLAAPSPGRYRLFFDFQVANAVHTAEFTLTVL